MRSLSPYNVKTLPDMTLKEYKLDHPPFLTMQQNLHTWIFPLEILLLYMRSSLACQVVWQATSSWPEFFYVVFQKVTNQYKYK